MPHEKISKSDPDGDVDMLVCWNMQDEHQDDAHHGTPYVSLFPVAAPAVRDGKAYDIKGGIYFSPAEEFKELFGLGEGDHGFGPVSFEMDREKVNRLITALRQARDEAFGADA